MSFGVTKTSPNAKTALDDASKDAEKITAAVKKAGVDDKDIQTQNVSVYPQTAIRAASRSSPATPPRSRSR